MEEIIVTNQAQLDEVPVDYNGRIIIKFGTPYNRAVVKRKYVFAVVAWENSSVEAWENSSVEAWGNSTVGGAGNAQIVDATNSHKIKVSGNARIVYNPQTPQEYAEFHELESEGKERWLSTFMEKIDGGGADNG